MNRFVNKPNRAVTHNYNWHGSYFVTICTNKRKQVLGKVSNHKIELSNM